MASPQAENGHVRIATELFEAECKVCMSGQEWQVYRFIQRKTWGWGKKSDAIPLMQIVEGTGVQKPRVCEALKALKERRMIVVRKNGPLGTNVIEIQKDFELWKVVRKNGLVRKSGTGGTLKRNQVVRKNVPSIATSNNHSSIATVELIVEDLNARVNGKFRRTTAATVKAISARLKDGAGEADFLLVHEHKAAEWLNDPKMSAYLRPATLYAPSKFEGYVMAAQWWVDRGRPSIADSSGQKEPDPRGKYLGNGGTPMRDRP